MLSKEIIHAELGKLHAKMEEFKLDLDTCESIPGPYLELRNLAYSLAWVLELEAELVSPSQMYEEEVAPHDVEI